MQNLFSRAVGATDSTFGHYYDITHDAAPAEAATHRRLPIRFHDGQALRRISSRLIDFCNSSPEFWAPKP